MRQLITRLGPAVFFLLFLLGPDRVALASEDDGDDPVLYAGTGEMFAGDGLRGAGIFKTTDAGATWTQLASTRSSDFFYVPRIVVSPNNSARVYAANLSGIWRSLDGGGTWQNILPMPGNGSACHELVIRTDMPDDYLFAACGL